MNKLLSLLLLFSITIGFSQEEDRSIVNNAIANRTAKYNDNSEFKRSRDFFIQQKWDSVLVSTSQLLDTPSIDKEVADYYKLFRAISFEKKDLRDQAKKEYDQISTGFEMINLVYSQLGQIEFWEKRYQESLEYYNKILNVQDLESYGIKENAVFHNVGLCYMVLQKYDEAETYLLKNLEYNEKRKDDFELFRCYSDLANLYYTQYKDNQAIPYFEKAYKLSLELDDFKFRNIGAKNMAVVEENRKDFRKALKYRKESEQWKDSLNKQNDIYETAQLEKKLAVEKKEQEVQVLEAENRAKEAENRVYLFSGILVFILLIIAFISYRETAKRNKIIIAQKEDLDQLNATKDKLFSIVSHDLRSSVNAIKMSNKKLLGNIETQDKEELTQTLQQNSSIVNGAYGLLDNLLNWAMLQTKQSYFEMTNLSLFQIVAHVDYNYKPILQEKKISYENSVSRKIKVFADQESLKIILRNLLDNAIKFSKDEGTIHIYAEENSEKFIDLIVEDSGLGMDEETRKELLKDTQLLAKKKHEDIIGTGLGMQLVKSMIAKNEGKFNIESEVGKGTKMIISLQKVS